MRGQQRGKQRGLASERCGPFEILGVALAHAWIIRVHGAQDDPPQVRDSGPRNPQSLPSPSSEAPQSPGRRPRSRKPSAASTRRRRIPRPSCNPSPVHAVGRGRSLGAGDGRGRQQGDSGAVRARRHAGENGRARRGQGARPSSRRSASTATRRRTWSSSHAGSWPSMAARSRAIARRSRRCPASAARPRTSCSTSRSARRRSRSDTHIFRVGNRHHMAPGLTPFEVEMKLEQVVPDKYKLHAHHWLILHGR